MKKPVFMSMFMVVLAGCEISDESAKESYLLESEEKHYVIFSGLEGRLVANGKPLPNAKIYRRLRWNGEEDGTVDEFQSDENGLFSIPVFEAQLTLNMLDQFVAKAELSVEWGSDIREIWYSSKFGPDLYEETEGAVSDLICDIAGEEMAVHVGVVAILTRCRWSSMPE